MAGRISDPRADEKKLADLRRVKALATLCLAGAFGLLILAHGLSARHPGFGYLGAFAEAATIGGLADWYAVVALFRRPMGIPIPHTAIIPENQKRIADNLGGFIETNFLAPATVERKLREVDFAAMVADWMADPKRSAALTGFVVRLAPQAVAAMEDSGLRNFVAKRVIAQLDDLELAPLAANLLETFTQDGKHQLLLDELMTAIHRILGDEASIAAIRDKVRDELPSLFRLFRADAYLMKKIVNSSYAFLDEVKKDPNHALRAEFDGFVRNFIERLRTSPEYAERAEALKRDLLARPELRTLTRRLWTSLKDFIDSDLKSETSIIRRQLDRLFVDIGRQLREDPTIRGEMNEGFVVALSSFIERQKSGVSSFIADQVKSWDMRQLTRVIEMNIGRDLQYIRFNGMLIGGLAGLALHALKQALGLL
ncbi:DUF445 domain-containing protein [Terrarubrum flagellatum]|uniref:DUF445 domain-containing protein n=1 Tax=Terrirubrum flagellatum TaxID=2895980 RepID=UPI00314563B3